MKNIDAIGTHSIELTTQVWSVYSAWSVKMAKNATAANGRKYVIKTPSLDQMVENVAPTLYSYLQEDDNVEINVKVQLLRSALLLVGHDECAKALRESVQSAGGKKLEDFKGLDASNRHDLALKALSNLTQAVVDNARQAHTAALGLIQTQMKDIRTNTIAP